MATIPGYLRPGNIPAPYLNMYVYLPAFDLRWWVPFLIDTGADYTTIHPRDWIFQIPRNKSNLLIPTRSVGGVGGSRQNSEQTAALFVFDDSGIPRVLKATKIDVGLLTPADVTGSPIPSLLGRDILNSGKLVVEPAANPSPVTLDLPTI